MRKKSKVSFLLCFLLFITCLISDASCFSTDLLSKKIKEKTDNKKDEGSEPKVKKPPLNESEYEPILVGVLLEKPGEYIDKKIKFRGRFSSFTTLALDYEPALRKSKDYISICLFRSDSKIPLSELKLAYPVNEAKDDEVIPDLQEGDLLEIYGKVFSAALDEPWVDILYLKKLESASKNSKDKADESKDKKNKK